MPRMPSPPPRIRISRACTGREGEHQGSNGRSGRSREIYQKSSQTDGLVQGRASVRERQTFGESDGPTPDMVVGVTVHVINHDCAGEGCRHCEGEKKRQNYGKQKLRSQRRSVQDQKKGKSGGAGLSRDGYS